MVSAAAVFSTGTVLRFAAQLPLVCLSIVFVAVEPLLRRRAEPEECDMRGKTCLVTGANCGIGFRTAERLARAGATVLIACRSPAKGAEAKKAIEKAARAEGRVEALDLDLSSLASVRRCAQSIGGRRIDVLVLNAGINANTPTATHTDLPGCSLVFGVNFVAHWLLYDLLSRRALADDARIVCLSSVMHHFARPAALLECDGAVGPADYAESKLAMNLLARAITRRRDARVGVAVNPGAVDSDIWRHVPFPADKLLGGVAAALFLTPDEGSATSVFAASAPLELDAEGQPPYLAPYAQPRGLPGASAFEYLGPFAGARPAFARLPKDEIELADKLWARCSNLCGAFTAPL